MNSIESVPPSRRHGVALGAGAYLAWGLLPVYWKAVRHVPPGEILAHRMVWSLAVVLGLLTVRRRWGGIGAALRNRRVLPAFTASALLLSLNWFLYIWAVNSGFIVESSLGYFINPLVNVLLGILFLRERLRGGQTVALLVAAAGVVYLTILYGTLPWIALTLAISFGFYALLRKTAALDSLQGLALETMMVFLPALGYLLFLQDQGRLAFGHGSAGTTLLLALSGAATAGPLLLFAAGARRIPLTMLGILQYISPTLQLLLGIFVYGEVLAADRLVGFCLIWLALAIYSAEGLMHHRRTRVVPA